MNVRWYINPCSWCWGIFFFNQIEIVVWIVVWLALRLFRSSVVSVLITLISEIDLVYSWLGHGINPTPDSGWEVSGTNLRTNLPV